MGKLTTHILDTARGRPGSGIKISVQKIQDNNVVELTSATTNDDGRVDGALLEGEGWKAGVYQLVFHTGAYQELQSGLSEAPRFLDDIVIRFGVSSPDEHYHVPLLLSPFGYSTYRGS